MRLKTNKKQFKFKDFLQRPTQILTLIKNLPAHKLKVGEDLDPPVVLCSRVASLFKSVLTCNHQKNQQLLCFSPHLGDAFIHPMLFCSIATPPHPSPAPRTLHDFLLAGQKHISFRWFRSRVSVTTGCWRTFKTSAPPTPPPPVPSHRVLLQTLRTLTGTLM